jgi:hypothetical protein
METVRCYQIRAAFRRGEIPSGAELQLHVRGCQDCAELFEQDALAGRALASLGGDDEADVPRLAQAFKRRLSAERGARAWLRSRRSRARVGLALVSAAALGAVGALGRRVETGHPATLVGVSSDFWPRASGCFIYGSLFCVAYLVLLWFLNRSDRISPSVAAVSAAVAGLVGNLTLHVHCSLTHPLHLLVGHASIPVVWALGYASYSWLRRDPLRSARLGKEL